MLQGSLDNFALDEVLGLLSSTSKTGLLEVTGDRGSGSLSLLEGRLVGAESSSVAHDAAPEDVIFELLRFAAGSFSFVVAEIEPAFDPSDIDDVLGRAEGRLADWRTIEAVIPSSKHMLRPVAELSADEVILRRDHWQILMAVGQACSVSAVCSEIGLDEVEGSRRIKGMVETGLLVLGEPDHAPSAIVPPPARRLDSIAETDSTRSMQPPPEIEFDDETELARTLPLPPTAADIRNGDNDSDNENDNDSDGDEPDVHAPGGLLMRYLKNER